MQVKVRRKQPNSKMCFVCGLDNKFGLQTRFFELEDDQLLAIFKPAQEHQGYPGRLHGGIAATILDETIGRAIMMTQSDSIWGVTIDFSMKLRRPVPMDGEIQVVSKIVNENKRMFTGSGAILLPNGEVAVEAEGKYLKMDIDKIADFDHQGDEWIIVPMADDPEYVELAMELPEKQR